jgi:hypothetical protein
MNFLIKYFPQIVLVSIPTVTIAFFLYAAVILFIKFG